MSTDLKPRIVQTARGPIELAEIGDGPPVLLVHGSPGDWRQGRPLAVDLAPDHRVLLPSRPGYGRTPLATGRDIADQADAYAALLDELGIDAVSIIGVSGGGPSSRAFAAAHPDRCTSLVLVCAVAAHLLEISSAMRLLAGIPGVWPAAARLDVRRKSRILGDPARIRAQVLKELTATERALADEDERVMEDLVTFFADHLSAVRTVTGLRNDYRTFRTAQQPAAWPDDAAVPSLVMHSDADTVVGLDHAEWHAKSIPGAVLEVLPDVGHAFLITQRRVTSARIADFLRSA